MESYQRLTAAQVNDVCYNALRATGMSETRAGYLAGAAYYAAKEDNIANDCDNPTVIGHYRYWFGCGESTGYASRPFYASRDGENGHEILTENAVNGALHWIGMDKGNCTFNA